MSNPGKDPLLIGLAGGQPGAFAALYDRYAGRLYRAALAILGRREDAEDAVQEVFMGLVRSSARLVEVRDLTAYLFTSLRRAAARWASGGPANRSPATWPSRRSLGTIGKARTILRSQRLARALAALPVERREVIALKIDGELTFAEIGRVMGVSMNTAASRYRYALEKLRTALGLEKNPSTPKE